MIRRLFVRLFAAFGLALVSTGERAFASRKLNRGQYAGSAVEVDTDADWQLIVAEGDYLNHGHGPHSVTREHLEQMASHFKTTSTALLVDYDHRSFFEGDTRAAGWSEDLRLTDRGLEMQKPVFSATAQKALDDREYRYYSPVYALGGEDKTGQATGARLISVGITGLPYFDQHEIDAIGNSAAGNTTPDPPPLFMERAELITLLGLAEDATDDQIKEALKAKKADDADIGKEAASSAVEKPEVKEPTVEERIAALEAERAEEKKASSQATAKQQAEALVNSALSDFKIQPSQKDIYVNSATHDYDGTKAKLDAIEKGTARPSGVRVNSGAGKIERTASTGFASGAARSYVDKALDGDAS